MRRPIEVMWQRAGSKTVKNQEEASLPERSGPLPEDIDLYDELITKSYYRSSAYSWEKQYKEGIQRVECLANGYCKPRYMLDHQRKVAF